MPLGTEPKHQHVLEFIPGTGVYADGILHANYNGGGVNGPWQPVVPDDVFEMLLDGTGPGGGGGGGYNSTTQRAGGGGASSGMQVSGAKLPVIPGSTLTVTLGAPGTGGPPGSDGTDGGDTTISGLASFIKLSPTTAGAIVLRGGARGRAATSTKGGDAGTHWNSAVGGTNAATPGNGGNATCGVITNADGLLSGMWFTYSGSGGGGADTDAGPQAGANGGFSARGVSGQMPFIMVGYLGTTGTGNQDGVNSYGGGGWGGWSIYGTPGNPGNGNAAAAAGSGYGYGGSAGGGNAAGADGGPAYVRLTYWSKN